MGDTHFHTFPKKTCRLKLLSTEWVHVPGYSYSHISFLHPVTVNSGYPRAASHATPSTRSAATTATTEGNFSASAAENAAADSTSEAANAATDSANTTASRCPITLFIPSQNVTVLALVVVSKDIPQAHPR